MIKGMIKGLKTNQSVFYLLLFFFFSNPYFFPLAEGYSRPLDVSLMKTSGFIENILCLHLDFVGRGGLPI